MGDLEAFQHIQHNKKRLFLEYYSDTGQVKGAAKATGIDRSTPYRWLKDDEEFASAYEEAEALFRQNLESVARELALEKQHPTMLIFLLKGEFPEKYADRQQVRHEGDLDIQHNLTGMDPEALEARLAELEAQVPDG